MFEYELVARGLHNVVSEWLSSGFYEKGIKERDLEILKRQGLRGKIRDRLSKHERELTRRKILSSHLNNAELELLKEIEEETNKDNISENKIRELEYKIIKLDSDFSKEFEHSFSRRVLYDCMFQFRDFAEKEIKLFLDITPENTRGFLNLIKFDALCKNAKKYQDLSEKVLIKLAEAYSIDVERGIKGKRKLAFISPGACFLPFSVADKCKSDINRLGEALGWTNEQVYQFVGMNKGEIEANDKAWSDKVVGMQRSRSYELYKEFENVP